MPSGNKVLSEQMLTQPMSPYGVIGNELKDMTNNTEFYVQEFLYVVLDLNLYNGTQWWPPVFDHPTSVIYHEKSNS